jgi:hypothetical protein
VVAGPPVDSGSAAADAPEHHRLRPVERGQVGAGVLGVDGHVGREVGCRVAAWGRAPAGRTGRADQPGRACRSADGWFVEGVVGPTGPAHDRICDMAKYLVLIYGDEQKWAAASPREQQRIDDGHTAFTAKAGAGVIAGGALEPTTAATSLRAGSAGRPTVTDGPFLETKEALGGYYLLEAADLDEAISLAGQLPEVSADHSGVEIRPMREPD